ncbi:hypothetical protein Q75_07710 [Bacillus coahuilensis p1.1.43]|uniref:Fluoride-specific ion channel FluC n=2 Tax=Bacillus coahuilensis TaxID=408580 RepID=A0A147K8D9_9BACI|nr:fluoride efflux transporter CrcB [Bacillus coahuilensis]KUP06418.1 hypothetical protein Q75_07710 [Bacillus coahuilensis p1.1.43]
MNLLAIFFGGMIGSIVRYVLVESFISDFPYGILLVNLIGSFLLGGSSVLLHRKNIPRTVRIGFTTGLIGSFTTYSTFAVENIEMILMGEYFTSFIYSFVSLMGGYFMAYLGISIAFNTKGERSV